MKTVLQKRYITDCGKNYASKASAKQHESYCRCWKNPKFKTCLSCKFKNFAADDNGMDGQYRQEWQINECKNPDMNLDIHFQPVHENANHICANCPKWEPK